MKALLVVLLVVAVAACDQPATGSVVSIVAVAGPTCPVVSDPPETNCDDRPVDGAVIIVRDEGGAEVARTTTDAEGMATVELPPGRYLLEPQPVEGLMGTAPPIDVTVIQDAVMDPVTVAYDTGIR